MVSELPEGGSHCFLDGEDVEKQVWSESIGYVVLDKPKWRCASDIVSTLLKLGSSSLIFCFKSSIFKLYFGRVLRLSLPSSSILLSPSVADGCSLSGGRGNEKQNFMGKIQTGTKVEKIAQ